MTDEMQRIARLLARREAALATQTADGPALSYLRFALTAEPAAQAIVFVSRLAAHTGQMIADPRVALLVTAADHEQRDAQQRARLSLRAHAEPVPAEQQTAYQHRYLTQLPTQQHLFALADFRLLRLTLLEARYIGGFARARDLSPAELAVAVRSAAELPAEAAS